MLRIDEADHDEPVDRLDGIDRVAAGDRNAGARAHGFAAVEDAADRLDRQLVDGHPDERQREERRAAHRVDVGDRVGRGDRAEVVRIVDDRHEEVGRRDDGLAFVQLEDRGVVRGLDADQQLLRESGSIPALPRICRNTAGAILQPQPPPWLNSVRRSGARSGAFIGYPGVEDKGAGPCGTAAKRSERDARPHAFYRHVRRRMPWQENHDFCLEIRPDARTPFLRRGLGVASRQNCRREHLETKV